MEWFSNVKLRSKLVIAFGMLLSIVIFFAVYAVVGIIGVGKNLEELVNSYQTRQMHVAEAITDVFKIRLVDMSKGYMIEDELKEIVSELHISHDENIELFRENLFAYCGLVLADAGLAESERQEWLDFVDGINELFDDYVEITKVLGAAVENNDKQEIINAIVESIPVGNELSYKVQELRDQILSESIKKASETQNVTFNIIHLISSISVICILLSALILLFTVHNINQPISKLEKAAVEISKGDFSYPIRSDRGDEFGTLANCIGDMIDELVKYNKVTAIMDNLDSTICVCDFEYNLLFANKRTAELFGFEREACVGQKCYFVTRKKDSPCSFCKMSELLPEKESFPSKDYEYM